MQPICYFCGDFLIEEDQEFGQDPEENILCCDDCNKESYEDRNGKIY